MKCVSAAATIATIFLLGPGVVGKGIGGSYGSEARLSRSANLTTEDDSAADRDDARHSVKRVAVVITEDSESTKGAGIPSISLIVRTILGEAGIGVINDKKTSYDALISIKVRATPVEIPWGGRGYYTDARVSGSIEVVAENVRRSATFSGYGRFPFLAGGRDFLEKNYSRPEQAPFETAFNKSDFPLAVCDVVSSTLRADRAKLLIGSLRCPMTPEAHEKVATELANLLQVNGHFDVKDVVSLLADKNGLVQLAAVRTLAKLKADRSNEGLRAVGPLIDYMKRAVTDGNTGNRDDAEDALRRITGEDLGKAPAMWQQWWDKHQDELKSSDGRRHGS